MKILVISDSHGNVSNLKHALGFGKKIGVGAIIHCGDWNTVQSIESVLEINIPLYSVLGNADIDPDVSKILAKKATKFDKEILFFELGNKKILISHFIGKIKKYKLPRVNPWYKKTSLKQFDSSSDKSEVFSNNYKGDFDVAFCGHIHKQTRDKNIFRPGALENNINFAIFDTTTGKINLINDKI